MSSKLSGKVMEHLLKILYRLQQLDDAAGNAAADFKAREYSAVYHLDWNVLYPSITPRDNITPTPHSNEHDYFRYCVLNEIPSYKNLLGGDLVISPLAIVELCDQILHRKDYFASVYNSKNTEDMLKAITSRMATMPATKEELNKFIASIVASIESTSIKTRLLRFSDLIKDGSVKNVFCIPGMDRDAFFDAMADNNSFDIIHESISQFRRPESLSDPVDSEMHKIIDVLMLLTSQAMQKDKYT